jgi:RHS repeat-associated protein
MTERFYHVNGQMMGYESGGVKKDFLTDHLGSITAEIDQNQNRTFETRYSAFGRNNWSTGTGCGFGWVGSFGYRETGLFHMSHYVRARHYSYVTGGWSTVDPLWPREHAYGYCVSSPTKFIDDQATKPTVPKWRGRSGSGMGWQYGSYCGSANIKNPGYKILPQDCVDACCLVHDRCLEANQGAGLSNGQAHSCCDIKLLQCVQDTLNTTCCEEDNNISHMIECRRAARDIELVFGFLGHGYPIVAPPPHCLPPGLYPKYSRIWWGDPISPTPKQRVGPSPWPTCPKPSNPPRPPGLGGPPQPKI